MNEGERVETTLSAHRTGEMTQARLQQCCHEVRTIFYVFTITISSIAEQLSDYRQKTPVDVCRLDEKCCQNLILYRHSDLSMKSISTKIKWMLKWITHTSILKINMFVCVCGKIIGYVNFGLLNRQEEVSMGWISTKWGDDGFIKEKKIKHLLNFQTVSTNFQNFASSQ